MKERGNLTAASCLVACALALCGCRRGAAEAETVPPSPPPAAAVIAAQLHGAVVFVGDSRIAYLATSNVADRAENLGVAGEDTPRLAARLRGVDLSGASAIVLETGANDWLTRPPGDFRNRYATALAELPSDRPLVAAAILPVNEGWASRAYAGRFDWRGADAAIAAWNVAVADLCRQRPRCTFVAVPPALLKDGQLDPAMTFDGVHLNVAGAAIWGGALRQALAAPS